ncbi:hypothetical protein DM558_00320 [Entomomonas moraniae]|uniref:Uncharacterized protein n=1 Tax=Entomomonas moraniae TaxID=2213226 RepID=A0A3S9XA42_9GAMM|nr:hypothetical protein [Entomomonas moraniae]AZS49314.1 hypothetical protein DM558_00320 [Entomomonas moraniae]
MQITQSHIDAWIKEQTQNLIDNQDVVIDHKVVVDLQTFWIEAENAFIEADSKDDQYTFLQSRLKGVISESRRERDLKIINEVAQRMLEPFAYEGALEQVREEQDDYNILGYEVRHAEGWY